MNSKDFESFPQQTGATQQAFMQRVYQWMSVGLTITGLIAYWVSTNIALVKFLAGGPFLICAIAEIGLVFWLSRSITKISARAAITGFLIYSALNGVTLSFIFLAYTGASIATTFFIAAGSFAGVSLFGWMTKSDLSGLGSYLMMALIGVVIGSLVNIFLRSSAFDWILTYLGLAVFIGLTAYDTQMLKQIHRNGTATEQIAVIGALKLYLDFINMFLFLLRLFGRRRD